MRSFFLALALALLLPGCSTPRAAAPAWGPFHRDDYIVPLPRALFVRLFGRGYVHRSGCLVYVSVYQPPSQYRFPQVPQGLL